MAKALEKSPERCSEFLTTSGIPVERLYTPEDISGQYTEQLGYPGQYPFTRGIQPTMYRGRFWTMRQYAGFATAEESNRRYRYLLEQGQTGISIAFDLPTQIGYDSDDPMAHGEVGKVGVAIDSLADMEVLFREIPLDKISTSMTINAPAAVLLAFYIAAAEKQGVPASALKGTIQNDILKEYSARGTYIFPPAPSMRLITNTFAFCAQNVPKWNTISISGYHIREAGSTAAQEIAFTLADGIAYVEAALDAGMDVDDFAGRLSFFFNAHNDLLEEVAKYRAARRLWAKIMKERFHAKKDRSMMLRFHTQTGGSTLTAQQPDNNIVRVAIQTLAAVLGGTQSLHTNSRDEALALPTEDSVRIALRTQQIVANESGVANTIDPLGGSYYVERMTDQLQQAAEAYIEKIDAMGGAVKAVEQGFIQREIAESAYRYGRIFYRNARASGRIPQISVIMGPCAGGAVYSPALTDFVIMVEKESQMFITGPSVIAATTGEEITAEELGGAETHTTVSGVAHLAAGSEQEALESVRRLLSYLPSKAGELPPILPWRKQDETRVQLDTVIPDQSAYPYDVHDVIDAILDPGSCMELQPWYADNIVVCFGRIGGRSVGVIANQPFSMGGSLDINASDKAARFIQLCDAFGIPLVNLVDVPGFLPGSDQEHAGIIRHGAKLLYVYSVAEVPKLTSFCVRPTAAPIWPCAPRIWGPTSSLPGPPLRSR